jgi:uncharacterized membrane protein (UPF0127 family)
MITLKVRIYKSIKDRTFGLIGHNVPEPVMFFTRFGIHSFGLKFPIDVLILDKNNKVVKFAKNLKPNHLFFWPPKFNKVLELPSGFILNNKIKREVTIEFTEI